MRFLRIYYLYLITFNYLDFNVKVNFFNQEVIYLVVSDPYISVLILAHNRRKFLFDAINSVLSQDFPRDKFEVLVVKYELNNDKEIDKKLEELGVRVINTKEVSQGAKIAIGAEEAKGEVLAFLDDDDLFLPTKLNRIYEVFNRAEKIGYYFNEVIPFDMNKNEEIKSVMKAREKTLLKFNKHFKDDLMIKGIDFWGKMPIFSIYFFAFNNSAISVKKDVILSFSKVYKSSEFNHAIDFLHPILSLELGYFTAIDKRKLTVYRIHSDQVTTMAKKFESFEDYVNYNLNIKEIQIRNLSLPFQLYKLNNAGKILTVFKCYMELVKQSYKEVLGLKTINSHKLSTIIFLLKNDRSFIYSPSLYFSYVFVLLPSNIKRIILKHFFKKHNNSM